MWATNSFKQRFALIAVLGSLALATAVSGWALLAYWVLRADPWQRQRQAVSMRSAVGERANIVLMGDSILKAISLHCSTAINMSVPGAAILDVPEQSTRMIGNLQPSSIVVLMGINDLRLGASAEAVADRTAALAVQLRGVAPRARITVLSILPIIENENALQATNNLIESVRKAIRLRLANTDIGFADISGLFGYDQLEPSLTEDGLHLNDAGIVRLAAVVGGIASISGTSVCP